MLSIPIPTLTNLQVCSIKTKWTNCKFEIVNDENLSKLDLYSPAAKTVFSVIVHQKITKAVAMLNQQLNILFPCFGRSYPWSVERVVN